jgi:signal transduction histidine kinase
MPKVVQKRWVKLFIAVTILMLTQVAWWLDVFNRNVRSISNLQKENAILRGVIDHPGVLENIQRNSYHKKLMFFSETAVFAALTAFGLYLLFRALRYQERAREQQKQFIETMTHESKTPLTALKLRLESILEVNSAEPQLSRELSQSLEEVRRLASVFEKALNLNRMESYAFRFEEILFSDLLKEVIRRMDPLFRQKNVAVRVAVNDNIWVKGDLFALQNTVQSLLENAVLYNDKTDRIVSVELSEKESEVLLRVSDNGPGIFSADREKVFDKFFRGKTSRKTPGTGLGLYLAKHIVESHSGKISIEGSGDGGACFQVLLPKLGAGRG